MKIDYIEIINFRNLERVFFHPGHSINIFYGLNGSGKTSLLEAIHYLGLGRSFRTRNLSRITQHEAPGFSILGQLAQNDGASNLFIGIDRKNNPTEFAIKIGGKPVSSLIELANALPIQLINADSHLLLTSGPMMRRQFLDWGVFHVEPLFYHIWQRANRIIKQRNAGLKSASVYRDISLWDEELEVCAIQLNQYRQRYIEAFIPLLAPMLESLLHRTDCTLHYYPGWNTEKALKESYAASFHRDKHLGYTQQGPHRADLQVKIKGIPVHDILSQGQQKLIVYALRLTQGRLIQLHSNKTCIFLIDDLPSELDPLKRNLIANIINTLDAQFFITGIEFSSLSDLLLSSTMTFHVERGKCSAIG